MTSFNMQMEARQQRPPFLEKRDRLPGSMELEAGSSEIQTRGPCLDILCQNL